MSSLDDFDVGDLVGRIGRQRGPGPGMGRNGRPAWSGTVEGTPALWVTWVTDAAKRLGRPVPESLSIDGRRVRIVGRRLTFGDRHYFECPHCGRRVEALYFLRRAFGCRLCLRLGYRSQMARPTSVWAPLDALFSRRLSPSRWTMADRDPVDFLTAALRKDLTAQVRDLVGRITTEGVTNEEPE